jgi:hypothetical protein
VTRDGANLYELSPAAAAVVGLLVADTTVSEFDPAAVTAPDHVWRAIRMAFPLPAEPWPQGVEYVEQDVT